MANEKSYKDVVGFIDEQIERLYEDESYLNDDRSDRDEYTTNGEKSKWTYFQEFTPSEQEAMEKDVTKLYDNLYSITENRLENLLSELTVTFVDPPGDEDKDDGETAKLQELKSKVNNKKSKGEEKEDDVQMQVPVIVCRRVDADADTDEEECTETPKAKCDSLLKELKDLRTSVLSEVGDLLDMKFTMYRRSLGINRAKNHNKLSEARTALKLFRKKYEAESAANMKERDRLIYSALEEKYQNTISQQEIEISQYQASVNMKTQRNLGLNQELLDLKAENSQLCGRIERLFEDLTNSYKRCEHVEKNERISKRKLFEATKKCATLQKENNRLLKSKRGKLSRNNTMKSSNNILSPQVSMSETDIVVDDAAIDDFLDQHEPPPCSNCPILQEQLDNYKAKIKVLKSTDSFDRYDNFDRCDTGLSEVSGVSRSGSNVESPDEFLRQPTQEYHAKVVKKEESDENESVGQQSVDKADEISENFTGPHVIPDNPHIPAFDDHCHNIIDAVTQEVLEQPDVSLKENVPNMTEMVHMIDGRDEDTVAECNDNIEIDVGNKEMASLLEDDTQVDEGKEEGEEEVEGVVGVIEKEEGGVEEPQYVQIQPVESVGDEVKKEDESGVHITSTNNLDSVTSDVVANEENLADYALVEGKQEKEGDDDIAIEVIQEKMSKLPSESMEVTQYNTHDSVDSGNINNVNVEAKQDVVQLKDGDDDVSVASHNTVTSIIADINGSMRSIERVESEELFSLEMSVMEEDSPKHNSQKPRKKSVSKLVKHQKQKQHNHLHSNINSHQKSKSEATYSDNDKQLHHQNFRPTPVEVSTHDDTRTQLSARMSSILHSPSSFIDYREHASIIEQNTDQGEDLVAMKQLLRETIDNQHSLEKEVSELQKSKQDQEKYIGELSGYIKTQDHIYNLKLKEREILLRELTEQTHDLRAQVIRDKRMFDEMKELADCNLPKIGIQKIKARKLASAGRKEEFPYFKLDLNSTTDMGPRPLSSGSGLQGFSVTQPLPDVSASASASLFRIRPISSPALNINDAVSDVCGALSPSRRSQFSSTGINAKKIEQSWRDEAGTDKQLEMNGVEDNKNTRYEVEEVRKKVALLVSHQDISMKRLRARPGGVSKS